MARHHATSSSFIHRLRPSPERVAAAAALHDANPLLQYQAAHIHEQRPPARHRRPFRSAIRAALT